MTKDLYAELELIFLSPAEGGRLETPMLDGPGYRPHLRVPPHSDLLGVEFVDGPDGRPAAGVRVRATIRSLYRDVSYDNLRVGARIEVLEGNTVVAPASLFELQ